MTLVQSLRGRPRYPGTVDPKGGPFLPSQLSSLCWWFQGDSLNSQADGSNVTSWNDDSGGRHHMHQFRDASRIPALSKNSLNGHSGVTFSHDYMLAVDRFVFGDNITFFFVFNCTSGSILGLWDMGWDNTHGHALVQRGEDGGCVDWYYNAPRIDLGLSAGNNIICVEAYENPNDTLSVWRNGTFINTVSAGSATGISYGNPNDTSAHDPPKFGVFDAYNSGSDFLGTIYETCWFNQVLSSTNRLSVQGYLQGKYRLP